MAYFSKSVDYISAFGLFGYLGAGVVTFVALSFGGALLQFARGKAGFGPMYSSRRPLERQTNRRTPVERRRYIESFSATIGVRGNKVEILSEFDGFDTLHHHNELFVIVFNIPYYGDEAVTVTFSGAPKAKYKLMPYNRGHNVFSVAVIATDLEYDCSLTIAGKPKKRR